MKPHRRRKVEGFAVGHQNINVFGTDDTDDGNSKSLQVLPSCNIILIIQ